MSDDDEAVMLIVILGNQYLPQKVTKALAHSTINSWLTGKIGAALLFHETDGAPPNAACLASAITGMYIAPATPTAAERIATACEKQANEGDEWKG